MIATRQKIYSFAEYLNYQDSTDNKYELFNGELIPMPPASGFHALILAFLYDYLIDLIVQEQVTYFTCVPSILRVFLQHPKSKDCHCLKRVIAGGEALSYELNQRFFQQLNCQLYNAYGPTEAAVDATIWCCQPNSQLIPIGRPIANAQVYILDSYLQPVPIGVAGELHIGGMGLARGYLNRLELTQEKFISNPFAQGKLYKTGDLARYLPDGNIDYLGRIDNQVKSKRLSGIK